ncbi:hypothetical protein D3C72_839170 [compost metagenome]
MQLAGLGLAVVGEVVPVPVFKAVYRVTDQAAALCNGSWAVVPAVHIGIDLFSQIIGQCCQACQKVFAALGHMCLTR